MLRMKKVFLIIPILFTGLLMQAQQNISDLHYINLQTNSGKPDSISNEHNYDYYNVRFKKLTKLRNAGICLTSASVGFYIGALITSGYNLNTTAVLFFSSVATLTAGVPLWIVGGLKRKKNRKEMEQIKRNTNITFGTTYNGVGLVLNF